MSVSHYVISTLNLIGLGATALGLCYTTQKYFGRVTNKVLRAVLVALPPALMYIVCVSLGIYGQWRGDPARAVLFTLLAVAACFGPAVVLSGKDIEFLNHSLYTMQRFQAAKLAVLYVIVLLLLVGYRAPLMGYLLATAAMVCLYIFVVFAVAGLYAIARFSTQATERQLVLTGFALTLFGIATQFIAPALDLLNIKVV